MIIKHKHAIPTGYLFTTECSRGRLETLSIGDYGKEYNVRAKFLGYNNPVNGVPNTYCMPLSEKWVVTLSTQYGCPMSCTFCDVPNIPFKGNATFQDLKAQLYNAISLFPSVKYTERLNIHFARMGEPIYNPDVLDFAEWCYNYKWLIAKETGLSIEVIHPVLTSSCPAKCSDLEQRLRLWCRIKNNTFNGQAGLQLSINSTSDEQRSVTYQGMQSTLQRISDIGKELPDPIGRKYCLNFCYATGNEVDGKKLAALFSPDKFMCKITPMHNNNACKENGIETVGGYTSFAPYEEAEKSLIEAGFDTLVFVPSMDEEDGLVTCGNLILGGSVLKSDESIIKIKGL